MIGSNYKTYTRYYKKNNLLVTYSANYTSKLIDIDTYEELLLTKHKKQVYDSTISNNTRYVVTSSADGYVTKDAIKDSNKILYDIIIRYLE